MLTTLAVVSAYLVSTVAAAHALLHKRDPRAALGWLVACLAMPGVGALLYLLFGMNRIRTRALSWQRSGKGLYPQQDGDTGGGNEIPAILHPPFATQNYQLLRQLSDNVCRRPLLAGNSVEALHNGEQAYPAMLEAIAAARHSIALATYIFDTDAVGRQFVAALTAAARRGVEVRVLVDGLGEMYSWPRVSRLFAATPVRLERFLPFTLRRRGIHFNLRSHRKVLVVDGSIGFTGGMNISRRHLSNGGGSDHVVDIHFRLAGPVVGQMQESFREEWHFACGETFSGRNYPPPLENGTSLCRAISAGPNEDYEKLVWITVGALNCARRRIGIMTPYFVPDRMLVSALNAAALRGVQVEIILPQRNNLFFVHAASRGACAELLAYGVRIYYQPPPFVHSKLLFMDEHYALVGSANVDPRSQRLNFEFNVEVYDEQLNHHLRHHFDATVAKSQPVTAAMLARRSLPLKLWDNFCRLFTPFL